VASVARTNGSPCLPLGLWPSGGGHLKAGCCQDGEKGDLVLMGLYRRDSFLGSVVCIDFETIILEMRACCLQARQPGNSLPLWAPCQG
jgi:hypothetical protein